MFANHFQSKSSPRQLFCWQLSAKMLCAWVMEVGGGGRRGGGGGGGHEVAQSILIIPYDLSVIDRYTHFLRSMSPQ